MIEIFNKGDFFKLYILGFEFSESNFQEDLDWINIEIQVKHEDLTWKAKGAYLTLTEIKKIELWLTNIANFSMEEKRLNFLENELSLEINSLGNLLSIYLDFNLHPRGEKYDYNLDKEYKITFPIDCKLIYKMLAKVNKTNSYLEEVR